MARFSEDDKVRLYIIKNTAESLGVGSWHDYTAIFNSIASRPWTQDGLSDQWRRLKKNTKSQRKAEATARVPKWVAVKKQVAKWLDEVSPVHRVRKRKANISCRSRVLPETLRCRAVVERRASRVERWCVQLLG
jgi:hypothetical protein